MKNVTRLSQKKLGQILIDAGLCTHGQVKTALEVQQKSELHEPLGQILLDTADDLSESDIARALATQFQLPTMFASNYRVEADVLELLAPQLMYDEVFIPVDAIGNTLVLVMGGLITTELVEQIEEVTGKEVFLFVSTRTDVMAALHKQVELTTAAESDEGDAAEDGFDWESMFDEADKELHNEVDEMEVVAGSQETEDEGGEFEMFLNSLGSEEGEDD